MKSNLAWVSVAVLAIAGGYATSSPAADSNLWTVQVRVSTDGLDLTTDAGADAMLKRLSRAATEACGGQPDHSPLVVNAERRFRLCRAKALARVVDESQSAALKARFGGTQEARILLAAR